MLLLNNRNIFNNLLLNSKHKVPKLSIQPQQTTLEKVSEISEEEDKWDKAIEELEIELEEEPQEIPIDTDNRLQKVLAYEDDNVIELEFQESPSKKYALIGDQGLEGILGISDEGNAYPAGPPEISKSDLQKIMHQVLGHEIGSKLEQKQDTVFEVPDYLNEFMREDKDRMKDQLKEELRDLDNSNRGNKARFLGNTGYSLTSLELEGQEYGIMGEFDEKEDGADLYSMMDAVELDYSIDIERSSDLISDNLSESEKRNLFENTLEVASDASREYGEDYEVGVELEDEESLMIYVKDHEEEEIVVTEYDEDIDSYNCGELEIVGKDAEDIISDALEDGKYKEVTGAVKDAVTGQPRNGNLDRDWDKVLIKDAVPCKNSQEKRVAAESYSRKFGDTGDLRLYGEFE